MIKFFIGLIVALNFQAASAGCLSDLLFNTKAYFAKKHDLIQSVVANQKVILKIGEKIDSVVSLDGSTASLGSSEGLYLLSHLSESEIKLISGYGLKPASSFVYNQLIREMSSISPTHAGFFYSLSSEYSMFYAFHKSLNQSFYEYLLTRIETEKDSFSSTRDRLLANQKLRTFEAQIRNNLINEYLVQREGDRLVFPDGQAHKIVDDSQSGYLVIAVNKSHIMATQGYLNQSIVGQYAQEKNVDQGGLDAIFLPDGRAMLMNYHHRVASISRPEVLFKIYMNPAGQIFTSSYYYPLSYMSMVSSSELLNNKDFMQELKEKGPVVATRSLYYSFFPNSLK